MATDSTDTTSVLGQYGEELVLAAYNGTRGAFDQEGYDVVTASGEHLQVKTYTKGRRPGVIRSFAYDVITLEVDPAAAANVVKAKRYSADNLFAAFRGKWETKYRHINDSFAAFGGRREDRFERGWTIGSTCRSPISRTCSLRANDPFTRTPVLHKQDPRPGHPREYPRPPTGRVTGASDRLNGAGAATPYHGTWLPAERQASPGNRFRRPLAPSGAG